MRARPLAVILSLLCVCTAHAQNPAPSISSISQFLGAGGQPITISGANFGAAQGSSIVTFGSATASVSAWSDTSITASVPSSLPAGDTTIVVTVIKDAISKLQADCPGCAGEWRPKIIKALNQAAFYYVIDLRTKHGFRECGNADPLNTRRIRIGSGAFDPKRCGCLPAGGALDPSRSMTNDLGNQKRGKRGDRRNVS